MEKRLLGSAFISDMVADKLLSLCNANDFYTRDHSAIYNIFKTMRSDGVTIDNITILDYVQNNETLLLLAVDLYGFAVSDNYFDSDIEQIKELSNQRKIKIFTGSTVEEVQTLFEELKSNRIATRQPFFTPEQIIENVLDYYKNGITQTYSTGFGSLDEYYRIAKGLYSVVTGIPSHGKSEWMDAVMINLATMENWKFLIFSPENLPISRHVRKLIEKRTRLRFRSEPPEMSIDDIKISVEWVNEHFKFINPTIENRNIDFILDQINGVDGVLIDPWNEIEHNRDKEQTNTEYIGQTLMKIKAYALMKDVHIWVVAHPTKMQKVQKNGNFYYPVPTPYDISDSAHWRNKPDFCISVYRPDASFTTQIHVQKVRHKDCGRSGEFVELNYDLSLGIYSD